MMAVLSSVGELLRQMQFGAHAARKPELAAKFERCAAKVHRGIVCAPSLYIT